MAVTSLNLCLRFNTRRRSIYSWKSSQWKNEHVKSGSSLME